MASVRGGEHGCSPSLFAHTRNLQHNQLCLKKIFFHSFTNTNRLRIWKQNVDEDEDLGVMHEAEQMHHNPRDGGAKPHMGGWQVCISQWPDDRHYFDHTTGIMAKTSHHDSSTLSTHQSAAPLSDPF